MHDWEFLGLILEVGGHQLVLFGACGGESGRRGDEADVLACYETEEEEDGCVDVGAE